MAREIERKFLVEGDGWRMAADGARHILQAYVAVDGAASVRVRIYDNRFARLTVKVSLTDMTRDEFEYPIPLPEAREMAAASRGRLIEKTRHTLSVDGFVWEIDEYGGALAGLVVAEVEMGSEYDRPTLPHWLGREVTGDDTWSNIGLAMRGLPEKVRP
ncbi:MAG: CYTH domain-containing protein [Oricola sp.]